jgi:putative transposase
MEAIRCRKTIQEIAADHAIHPDPGLPVETSASGGRQRAFYKGEEEQATVQWASQGGGAVPADWTASDGTVDTQKDLSNSAARALRNLVDHEHPHIRVGRQCVLLGLPRSTLYCRPAPVRESTLRIMAGIDALYLEDPCIGSGRKVDCLTREGIAISLVRIRNLTGRMGSRAIFRKPRTTIPGDQAERFPCLMDLNSLTAVDQDWAKDITYICCRRGSPSLWRS